MPTAKKAQMIDELQDRITRSTIAVGTGYRGLTVLEMDQLRRRMRAAGIELRVVKNTLTRLAAERAGKPTLSQLVDGPTALAFGYGDILAVARAFSEYAPTAPPAFSIRAVYLDGQVLPGRELGELARLPTKEVLLAQVIGQLQSPVAVLAGLLEAPVTELARLLDAMANQLPGLLEARARQLESA